MKKLLLASAVAALSVTAQAAPQVYGKAFLSVDYDNKETKDNGVKKDDKSRAQLNSNFSRIGIKGSEPLTADITALYQLEYGVDVDADKGENFKSRDTFLGLQHAKYGTALAGRLTSIDDMVNYADVTKGSPLIAGPSYDGIRANNAVAYVSPEFNGVKALGMYVLDENDTTDTLGRDAFGVGAQYEPAGQPFKAGATYIQSGKKVKVMRVSGEYQVNPQITAGALYQVYDKKVTKDSAKENTIIVSGQYAVPQTPWTAYAQVNLIDNQGGEKGKDAQSLVAGGKYAFKQNITGHVYGSLLNGKEDPAVSNKKTKGVGIGAGLEYNF